LTKDERKDLRFEQMVQSVKLVYLCYLAWSEGHSGSYLKLGWLHQKFTAFKNCIRKENSKSDKCVLKF